VLGYELVDGPGGAGRRAVAWGYGRFTAPKRNAICGSTARAC